MPGEYGVETVKHGIEMLLKVHFLTCDKERERDKERQRGRETERDKLTETVRDSERKEKHREWHRQTDS